LWFLPVFLLQNMFFVKNSSLEHEHCKWKVAEDYRNEGYKVIEEKPIGEGRSVDLVAKKDGTEIAIEIETGKADFLGNIKKWLTFEMSGFSRGKNPLD